MKKVYLLGGGLATGSALYHLGTTKNYLLEQNENLGGRVITLERNHQSVEAGARFFSKKDPNVTNLITQLKLDNCLNEIFLDTFSVYFEGNFISLRERTIGQLTLSGVEELADFYAFVVSLREDFFLVSENKLLSTPFDVWYKKNIGYNTLWFPEALCRAFTFSAPHKLSAFFGIIVCSTFFDKAYTLEGGMRTMMDSLLKESAVEVHANTRVDEIGFECNRVKYIRTAGKKGNKIIHLPRDSFVISGLPAAELRKITSEKKLSKPLKSIDYASSSFALFQTKKKLLNGLSGILFPANHKISVVIEETKYASSREKGLLSVILPYKKKHSEREDIETIIESLEELIPNIRKNIESVWIKQWDYGLPVCSPKFYKVQESIGELLFENFAIAGDFMGLPSLDTAIGSGFKAAERANNYFNEFRYNPLRH